MDKLGYEIDEDRLEYIESGDIDEVEDFINDLNFLVDEGYIEMEEDSNGEIRFYPVV